jgi:hypothetical protein
MSPIVIAGGKRIDVWDRITAALPGRETAIS